MISATHPTGLTIEFSPEDHRYKISQTGQVLISVTTILKDFFPIFDTEVVAEKCAIKRGVSKQSLIDEWAAEGERGRTEGTNVHEYVEWQLLNRAGAIKNKKPKGKKPRPISERAEALFHSADRAIERLTKYYKFIATEKIIFSPTLEIAGTIDLLYYDPGSDCLLILDWKQNKVIKTENQWQSGLPPIGHLADCDFNKYALQLSLYKKILTDDLYYEDYKPSTAKLGLIHLLPNAEPNFIPIPDMAKEINYMLSYNNLKLKKLGRNHER